MLHDLSSLWKERYALRLNVGGFILGIFTVSLFCNHLML